VSSAAHTLRDFGPSYLQARIDGEIALARHIGIVVEQADDENLVLSAPLQANANHKSTAFGGSLYCVAVLTAWAWATRYLDMHDIGADAVVQQSNMEFLAPVHGELRAQLVPPAAAEIDKFRRMLERAGRGRIRLRVELRHAAQPAARFDGMFAAALRTRSS
jgi:thioesterase domain-containing protein